MSFIPRILMDGCLGIRRPPLRSLTTGEYHFALGWLCSANQAECNISGDLGDFASFVTHMRQIALKKDVDLLLVDTGDLHDGTGLSDGFPPGDSDGHDVS